MQQHLLQVTSGSRKEKQINAGKLNYQQKGFEFVTPTI
jgi:hypothetical protein